MMNHIEKTHNSTGTFRDCPLVRPSIRIVPALPEERIREIDCRELRWWGIVPLPGQRAVMAIYDLPEWRLTSVTELSVTGIGSVHGVDGAVITQAEWERADAPDGAVTRDDAAANGAAATTDAAVNGDNGVTGEGSRVAGGPWRMERMRVMGRLTDDCAQWLAMLTDYEADGDGMAITTFLDETFQAGFPDLPRRIVDAGHWTEPEPGVLDVGDLASNRQVCWGAGTFDVTVGPRTERCMRVFECTLSERSMLIEAYVTAGGRTVLVRRYNGFQWRVTHGRASWDARLKGQPVLRINGISFIHWYDCVFRGDDR